MIELILLIMLIIVIGVVLAIFVDPHDDANNYRR